MGPEIKNHVSFYAIMLRKCSNVKSKYELQFATLHLFLLCQFIKTDFLSDTEMKCNEIMPHVHFSLPHIGLAFKDFKFMKSSFSLIPHLLLKAMV